MAHERWTKLALLRWKHPISAVIFSGLAFFLIVLVAATGPRLDRDATVVRSLGIPVTFQLSAPAPPPQRCDAEAPWFKR
jgi:hypothetical protein